MSEDELIGLVLGFAIIVTAVQAKMRVELEHRQQRRVQAAKKAVKQKFEVLLEKKVFNTAVSMSPDTKDAVLESLEEDAVHAAVVRIKERRGVLQFAFLIVGITQRITIAICVQLLAASVKAQQPSRLVRTVSLISLACFFVLVESLTSRSLV